MPGLLHGACCHALLDRAVREEVLVWLCFLCSKAGALMLHGLCQHILHYK